MPGLVSTILLPPPPFVLALYWSDPIQFLSPHIFLALQPPFLLPLFDFCCTDSANTILVIPLGFFVFSLSLSRTSIVNIFTDTHAHPSPHLHFNIRRSHTFLNFSTILFLHSFLSSLHSLLHHSYLSFGVPHLLKLFPLHLSYLPSSTFSNGLAKCKFSLSHLLCLYLLTSPYAKSSDR